MTEAEALVEIRKIIRGQSGNYYEGTAVSTAIRNILRKIDNG